MSDENVAYCAHFLEPERCCTCTGIDENIVIDQERSRRRTLVNTTAATQYPNPHRHHPF